MTRKKIPPIHPGIILQEEFLVFFGLSQTKLATDKVFLLDELTKLF